MTFNFKPLQSLENTIAYETFARLRGPDNSISPSEDFWQRHYLWLKENGYQLRPRYAPDWIPSWRGTDKDYLDCEDGPHLIYGQICDAFYIPTGTRVALKEWRKKPGLFEEDIHRFLTSAEMLSDPRNHCVPLLDVLIPPEENMRILVMPLLRPFNSPVFDTIGEGMECIRQLFEGLQFMHEHHVTHRDLNMNNFLMESQAMFPEGYHAQVKCYDSLAFGFTRKADLSGRAKFFTRTQRPPNYYIIDFGLSRQYDATETCPQELPIEGGDKTVPEFKDMSALHNPYWTDVYYAGSLVRQYFIEGHPLMPEIYAGYRGFDFLKPLINDMVQDDPSKRPTMAEVVDRFQMIMDNTSSWKLRSRPSWRLANIFEEIVLFVSHWKRRIVFVITRTPAIPRPQANANDAFRI